MHLTYDAYAQRKRGRESEEELLAAELAQEHDTSPYILEGELIVTPQYTPA
jgi:hypothetical protein